MLAWDDSGQLIPSPFFEMEASPGALLSALRPSLDPGASQHVDDQLARLVASMHAITAPEFGRPDPSATHDAPGARRLVHWDLWDPNVFIDPETCEVVGVIDFERVLWADPLIEAQFRG